MLSRIPRPNIERTTPEFEALLAEVKPAPCYRSDKRWTPWQADDFVEHFLGRLAESRLPPAAAEAALVRLREQMWRNHHTVPQLKRMKRWLQGRGAWPGPV